MGVLRRAVLAVVKILRDPIMQGLGTLVAILVIIFGPARWIGIVAFVIFLLIIIIANRDKICDGLRNLIDRLGSLHRGIFLLAGVIVGALLAIVIAFWPESSDLIIELLRPTPAEVCSERIAILTAHDTYISAMDEQDGWDWELWAERRAVNDWEWFTLLQLENGRVALRTRHGRFVSATRDKGCCNWILRAETPNRGRSEEFTLEKVGDDKVAFKTYLGRYISATDAGQSWKVRAETDIMNDWEKFTLIRPEMRCTY